MAGRAEAGFTPKGLNRGVTIYIVGLSCVLYRID